LICEPETRRFPSDQNVCGWVLEFSAMLVNTLYLTVLPLIRPTFVRNANALADRVGVITRRDSVEQVLTLYGERNLATEFFPDEVQAYVDALEATLPSLTGGHVIDYQTFQDPTNDGRVVVRVVQRVR
jgi:hypothetical protein